MTKGEKWKKFFSDKGWLKDDVISAGDNDTLKISIRRGNSLDDQRAEPIESALMLEDYDILCYETRNGTVFFQWDDIMQVKLEEDKKKRKWL